MMKRMATAAFFLVFLLTALMVCGCSKINKDNYEKIQPGLTYEQVEDILGDPDECASAFGTRNCLWGTKEGKNIQVMFVGDTVMGSSEKGL